MDIISSSIAKRTAILKMKEYFISIKNDIIFNDDIKQFSNLLELDYNILLKEYQRNTYRTNNNIKKEKIK